MLGVPTCRRHKQTNKLKTPTFFATLDYIMYVPSLGFIHLVHVHNMYMYVVCRPMWFNIRLFVFEFEKFIPTMKGWLLFFKCHPIIADPCKVGWGSSTNTVMIFYLICWLILLLLLLYDATIRVTGRRIQNTEYRVSGTAVSIAPWLNVFTAQALRRCQITRQPD